jgi:GMP synthase-like glutamine amidotransferase
MRAHYLQHVPFEGLGSIEPWLRAADYEITSTRFFESTDLPNPDEIDLLIVMGGPMSVNDEAEHPWLIKEKRFIRRCIEGGKSALGVCLGAQLIASAMGARVYRHHTREIGWFPIQAVPVVGGSTFCFPASVEVFHWHGETFDLPPGARLLARSEACENQAFQLGRSVIGLQFHLETTPDTAREIVAHCRGELLPSKYVQSEAEIVAAAPEKYQNINQLMAEILSCLRATDVQAGPPPDGIHFLQV